ncbi:hypothetical protein Vadar_004168 [Vaccinium darrowii]|uniref:Uncharacterized protein n=1 Tax=Vaccinium darrowii TaxID=229202 RepID=A0ACB7XWR6_9ERIC|nr:hypothetical protein Vadar_004168 [Vaccinium darrowii]
MKGDVPFEKLSSVLHAEESQIRKDEGTSSAKVFVATQNVSTNANMFLNQSSSQPVGHAPIFQNSPNQGNYFPQQYLPNTNRNVNATGGFNRGKGYPPQPSPQSTGFSVANVVSRPLATANWFFDSAASTHVTNDLTNLTHHQSCSPTEGVQVGNGASLPVSYFGK